jgi:hypothetical protein
VSGLARRSRIGWHERNTIIRGLAEDGRILTHYGVTNKKKNKRKKKKIVSPMI